MLILSHVNHSKRVKLILAFIIDPIHLLDPCHDTSVALIEAAQILGQGF